MGLAPHTTAFPTSPISGWIRSIWLTSSRRGLCQQCSPGAGGGQGRDVSEEGWMPSPCSPYSTNHPCKKNKWAQKAVRKLLRERSPPGMSQAPKHFKELFWLAIGTNCPAEPLMAFFPTDSLPGMPLGRQTQGCHRWSCRTQGSQQDIACHGPSVSQTQQSVWENPWKCLRDPWAARPWGFLFWTQREGCKTAKLLTT